MNKTEALQSIMARFNDDKRITSCTITPSKVENLAMRAKFVRFLNELKVEGKIAYYTTREHGENGKSRNVYRIIDCVLHAEDRLPQAIINHYR